MVPGMQMMYGMIPRYEYEYSELCSLRFLEQNVTILPVASPVVVVVVALRRTIVNRTYGNTKTYQVYTYFY